MKFYHFPQEYISNEKGAETKLSKSQQINAINFKNVQEIVHVPNPWILKEKILEHVIWRT